MYVLCAGMQDFFNVATGFSTLFVKSITHPNTRSGWALQKGKVQATPGFIGMGI